MAMTLDRNTLVPILESAGFSQTNKDIWIIEKDGTTYGVDFAKNSIFRLEDNERIFEDKDDEYLGKIKEICVMGQVNDSKEEKKATTAPCEVCKQRCEFDQKYEKFICPECHKKADEHGEIPSAVLIVGWEEYEKMKDGTEEPTKSKEFADAETEDTSKNNNAPEKDKPIDEPAKQPPEQKEKQSKVDTPILDLIDKYVGNDVLEVFGDTGSGKSRFALQTAREAIAAGKTVYFLDTERNLTEADISSLKGCQYKYTPVLEEIDKLVQELPKVDVVILDSIGFPVLTTYARLSTKQKGDALLKLIAIFGDLKKWAYQNNGVAIVTNQPESEFNKDKNHVLRPFGDKSQFAAKEIWKTEFAQRTPTLTKSRIVAFRSRSVGQKTRIADMSISTDGVEVKA